MTNFLNTDREIERYDEAELYAETATPDMIKGIRSSFNTDTGRTDLMAPLPSGGFVTLASEAPEIMMEAPAMPGMGADAALPVEDDEFQLQSIRNYAASGANISSRDDYLAAGYSDQLIDASGVMGETQQKSVSIEPLSTTEIEDILSKGGTVFQNSDPTMRENGAAALTETLIELRVNERREELLEQYAKPDASEAETEALNVEISRIIASEQPEMRSLSENLADVVFGNKNVLGTGVGDFVTAGVMDMQEGWRMYTDALRNDSPANRALGVLLMAAGVAEATGVGMVLGKTIKKSIPMMQRALVSAGQNAELRMAERGPAVDFLANTMMSGVDPTIVTDPLVAAAGRAVTPELNQVLNVMAEQMKVPPKDRVQPSGSGSIFELTPEAYERIEFEQKETPVPRAPEGKKLPLNNRGAALVDMSDRISDVLAERAKPYIGNNVQFFYHTGPLIEKAVALGIPEDEARKQLKMFALNYAATSPRTQTEPNLKNASLVSAKQKAGIDVREIVGPGGEGINEKGYPMIINEGGLHLKLIGDAAGDGIDFNVNPKPATFAENVNGNLAGVTVDTHAIRAVLDAMNEIEPGSIPIEFIGGKTAAITKQNQAKYLADPSSFNAANMVKDTLGSQKIDGVSMQTEYAIFSDIYKMVAEKIGVQPAEAQSLSWFANGNKTGLGSAPKTIVELIEDRIDVTAQLLGQTKDEVFKKFMQGSVPLLSIGGGMALMETGTMQDSEAN